MSSSATNGAFIVYLEDVGPDGEVLNVTDGLLRAAFRRTGPAPYWVPGPYRALTRADEAPLVAAEVVELDFDLYPVSWLFREGHAIRVAIAGSDKDNFEMVPPGEPPTV